MWIQYRLTLAYELSVIWLPGCFHQAKEMKREEKEKQAEIHLYCNWDCWKLEITIGIALREATIFVDFVFIYDERDPTERPTLRIDRSTYFLLALRCVNLIVFPWWTQPWLTLLYQAISA